MYYSLDTSVHLYSEALRIAQLDKSLSIVALNSKIFNLIKRRLNSQGERKVTIRGRQTFWSSPYSMSHGYNVLKVVRDNPIYVMKVVGHVKARMQEYNH